MSKTADSAPATGLPQITDRRQLLAGLLALSVAGTPCLGSPLATVVETTRADMEAKFFELWERMNREQQLIYLDLLRELAKLPEGADHSHHFAAADAQLAELRRAS